jgi:hypothetical protein
MEHKGDDFVGLKMPDTVSELLIPVTLFSPFHPQRDSAPNFYKHFVKKFPFSLPLSAHLINIFFVTVV